MGQFNNKIEAEFDPPRKWILSRALTYTNTDIDVDSLRAVGLSIDEHKIIVDEEFVTDLASVPRMCWAFIAPWMLLALQLFTIYFINVFVNIVVLEEMIRK